MSKAANLWSNPALEVARGEVQGQLSVNKFGQSFNVDSGVDTDIWDAAAQPIWLPPTQARIHQIVSTDAGDDGDPVGVGARTIRIYGLTDWDTAEVSEDIVMNGITDVPTVNAYVIIHRMKVLTKGATASNVGVITATADTDGTVTAQIAAGTGQTLMAIYGVPSIQTAYMTCFYQTVIGNSGVTQEVITKLLSNPEPNAELLNYLTKHTGGLVTTAGNHAQHFFDPYKEFPGPCIIKLQGNGSAADMRVSGGFDLILCNN